MSAEMEAVVEFALPVDREQVDRFRWLWNVMGARVVSRAARPIQGLSFPHAEGCATWTEDPPRCTCGAHPDAGRIAMNHYDWFMPADPGAAVDGYLDDFERKMTDALTDPFVHDMAQSVLPLIAAYRSLKAARPAPEPGPYSVHQDAYAEVTIVTDPARPDATAVASMARRPGALGLARRIADALNARPDYADHGIDQMRCDHCGRGAL